MTDAPDLYRASDDETQLRCTIHETTLNGVRIEADIGEAWFSPQEFTVLKRASKLEEVDVIRISLALAIERGIT